jgi:hypothetical protein
MKTRNTLLIIFILAFAAFNVTAQDAFGFGDEAAKDGSTEVIPTAKAAQGGQTLGGAKVGGELTYDTTAFIADPADAETLSGAATGRLNFTAKGSSAEASLKLKINEKILSESPKNIVDEAAVRMYLGKLDLEGGLLKVTWGKADSEGPLDVLNPLDYTDLTVTDTQERKIAQPMLHASYALGSFSKIEAAFLPGFEGNRIAWSGPWTPSSVRSLKTQGYSMLYYGTNPTANGGRGDGLYANYYASAWSSAYSAAWAQAYSTAYATAIAKGATTAQATATATSTVVAIADAEVAKNAAVIASQAAEAANAKLDDILEYPETRSLEYAQGGLRLNVTVAGADLGFQYFTGFLPNPVVDMNPADIVANDYHAEVSYNRYHQAGMDFAMVIAGFNLRSELAANLTDDFKGDDPEVYNPTVAWSLGFDRDLFAGINLNLQYAGTYRLFDDGVGDAAYDIEAGTDITRSKITAVLKKNLFKDRVELELTGRYGIEDQDYLLLPRIGFLVGDAQLDLSAGFFGGDDEGELGQFDDYDYCRLTLSYQF